MLSGGLLEKGQCLVVFEVVEMIEAPRDQVLLGGQGRQRAERHEAERNGQPHTFIVAGGPKSDAVHLTLTEAKRPVLPSG